MNKVVSGMSTDIQEISHFINGEEQKASVFHDHVDPGRLDDVVVRLAKGTPEDVDRAVQAAHAAFPAWRDTAPAERVAQLSAAIEAMGACAEELAPLMVREHGGMLWEAQADFALGTAVTQHTLSLVDDFLQPMVIDEDAAKIVVERMPRGVAAGIVPWNMPLVLAMMKIAPALSTGNTMVIKPSPFAAGGHDAGAGSICRKAAGGRAERGARRRRCRRGADRASAGAQSGLYRRHRDRTPCDERRRATD